VKRQRIVLVASFAESVPAFRGALIRAMLENGALVDVAVPLVERGCTEAVFTTQRWNRRARLGLFECAK